MRCLTRISAFWIAATTGAADVPRVAVDIAPVHSLVSQVMEGVGTPDLIIPPGASPHGYAMRPSEARALSRSDLVVWVGPGLTPWLEAPLDNLAPDAVRLGLMEVDGITLLVPRKGAGFNAHKHEHENDHRHEADHEADHGHDNHRPPGTDHDDHGAVDPHLWLDPVNARIWLHAIAEQLEILDPANASHYAANVRAAMTELDAVNGKVTALLAPLRGQSFVVFHDAYHYFEARFGVEAVAAISMSDDAPAGAAHLRDVEAIVAETDAQCVLAEPRASSGLIDAIGGATGFKVQRLDASGLDLPLGPSFYSALLLQVAEGISDCLTPP